MRKSMFWLTIAALIVLPMEGAVTVPDNTQVRNELSSYFGRIAENSPTVLGGLAKSPDTMNAIQKRIASMTDAELSISKGDAGLLKTSYPGVLRTGSSSNQSSWVSRIDAT